jgi:hypothetical protein
MDETGEPRSEHLVTIDQCISVSQYQAAETDFVGVGDRALEQYKTPE